ncbi:hypothetical protein [Actinoplanes sp. NPDC049118]|uniref:hypothetical protein n=1 Tax=Actinoplanes sp. NPDC049118 TaxID=3155769 RepID=UPI0033F026C8
MSQVRHELEPRIAASLALDALSEAGRFSANGLGTVGARAGRRAAVAGAEGARRTGRAWAALRGAAPPPPRRVGGIVVVAVAAGGVAALAIRRGVVAWRASGRSDEVARRLRDALRPAPAVGPPVDSVTRAP